MASKNVSAQPLLNLKDIAMNFGSVKALREVDFDLLPGEVHGLLGQNGAGKSTLIKVISGVYQPSSGSYLIDGKLQNFLSPRDSRNAGIAVVYQSLSLVPSLTVAQNLFLGIEPTRLGIVRSKEINAKALEFLESHKLPLRPEQTVSSLTFAYRQLCEIGKALISDARILILDEPTSSLSKAEEPILFEAVREATKKGIGVIYVSHRLSEVLELTDRVTVIRDGRNAGVFNTSEVTIPDLVNLIVGEKETSGTSEEFSDFSKRNKQDKQPIVLEIEGLTNNAVSSISLSLRKGEVVGLVGSIGSGRTELLESIYGVRKINSGLIRCDGKNAHIRRPQDAIDLGIKLIPEDRHKFGLVVNHDIESNTAMSMLPMLRSFGFLFDSTRSKQYSSKTVERLNVKAPSISTKLDKLSGGNQQKIVIGKWLSSDTKVLLLDEPTAGVDVGARSDIYKIILDLADSGTAVLMASSDYDELLQICDRFLFINDGVVTASADRSQVKEEKDLHEILEASRRESSNA